jgi:hypothetical protein
MRCLASMTSKIRQPPWRLPVTRSNRILDGQAPEDEFVSLPVEFGKWQKVQPGRVSKGGTLQGISQIRSELTTD